MSNNDFNTYAVGDTPLEADSTLLDRARAAKNGEKFGAYYDRGEFPRGALSRAEFGLCMMLTFWCNCHTPTIDRLYRRSALYRAARWDQPYRDTTYGAAVIAAACDRCESVYRPKQPSTNYNRVLAELGNNTGGADTVTCFNEL